MKKCVKLVITKNFYFSNFVHVFRNEFFTKFKDGL